MANVAFRNATSASGNPAASQAFALPTILAGDWIGLVVAWNAAGTISISGAGTWTHQGTDALIAAQLTVALYTAISTDGSESGQNVTINVSTTEKFAAVAASYSGVNLGNPIQSGPTYATFTTSNTTSATSPSVSPVPAAMVIECFSSKSSTNTGYSGIPGALSNRQQILGSGGGGVDLMWTDSNGAVSSAGGHTVTESIATGNKAAMTLVLNTAPAMPLRIMQAVNRAAVI